jgi:hypothetical protein
MRTLYYTRDDGVADVTQAFGDLSLQELVANLLANNSLYFTFKILLNESDAQSLTIRSRSYPIASEHPVLNVGKIYRRSNRKNISFVTNIL